MRVYSHGQIRCAVTQHVLHLFNGESLFNPAGSTGVAQQVRMHMEVEGADNVRVPSSRLPAGCAFILTHPVAATAPKQLEDY